jgi:hypothetical protein
MHYIQAHLAPEHHTSFLMLIKSILPSDLASVPDAGSRPHRHLLLCSYPVDSNNYRFSISEARVIYSSLIVQSIEIFSLSRQEQLDLLSTFTLFHDTKWSLNASKSIISDSDSSALCC